MPHRLAVSDLPWRTRAKVLAPFGVLAVLILGTGWATDHRSCQRQVDVRAAMHQAALALQEPGGTPPTERGRKLAEALAKVQPLNCGGLLPGE